MVVNNFKLFSTARSLRYIIRFDKIR